MRGILNAARSILLTSPDLCSPIVVFIGGAGTGEGITVGVAVGAGTKTGAMLGFPLATGGVGAVM